jgi:hypothetical protein
MEKIIAFFALIGFPLTHFPETEDRMGVYQYDGGNDGLVIQIWTGHNLRREPSTFGLFDFPDGRAFDLSFPIVDWELDETNKYSPKHWVNAIVEKKFLSDLKESYIDSN